MTFRISLWRGHNKYINNIIWNIYSHGSRWAACVVVINIFFSLLPQIRSNNEEWITRRVDIFNQQYFPRCWWRDSIHSSVVVWRLDATRFIVFYHFTVILIYKHDQCALNACGAVKKEESLWIHNFADYFFLAFRCSLLVWLMMKSLISWFLKCFLILTSLLQFQKLHMNIIAHSTNLRILWVENRFDG